MRNFVETKSPLEETVWEHTHPIFSGNDTLNSEQNELNDWTDWLRDPESNSPSDWNSRIIASVEDEWRLRMFEGVDRILDVGCGIGMPSLYLARAGKNVTGIDPSSPNITSAKRLMSRLGVGSLNFENVSLEEAEFPDGFFDGASFAYSINCLSNFQASFANLTRMLVPGAPIAITEHDWLKDMGGKRYQEEASLLLENDDVFFLLTVKSIRPYRLRSYRCRLNPSSLMAVELKGRLEPSEGKPIACSQMGITPQLIAREVEAANYRETTGYDSHTLHEALEQSGMMNIRFWSLPNGELFAQSLQQQGLLEQIPDNVNGVLKALVHSVEPSDEPFGAIVSCQTPFEVE